MDAPRVVRLPAYRVAKLRYQGPRPPAPAFFAHWRQLNGWAARHGVVSPHPDVTMIGYEPPGRAGSPDFTYEACIPIPEDFTPADPEVTLGGTPAGRFVLCAGELRELPALYREARRHAAAHGLAIERGGIELYRPHPRNPEDYLLDVGCRIHD